MYIESIFIVFMFHTRTIFSRLLGEPKEEATTEPMDIQKLGYEEWCRFQPNEYDCGEKGILHSNWYYYDIKFGDCKVTPIVGDCNENRNAFASFSRCKEACREAASHPLRNNYTDNVSCRLQFDFGACDEYHPMWYYDVSSRTCRGFSYSGCGGNRNRFLTNQDCTTACLPNVEYTPYRIFK
ncbi:amblin-like [Amyelois transitella]|uniref:amblin-like n=1 Tax=Amyelois transitella TaxID=680683 RepID=UPI00298FE808|nr:amblin-like [Amyelois transitella]